MLVINEVDAASFIHSTLPRLRTRGMGLGTKVGRKGHAAVYTIKSARDGPEPGAHLHLHCEATTQTGVLAAKERRLATELDAKDAAAAVASLVAPAARDPAAGPGSEPTGVATTALAECVPVTASVAAKPEATFVVVSALEDERERRGDTNPMHPE